MIREEERKQAAKNYALHFPPEYINERTYIEGAEWADSHAWKNAQGDNLPEIDREVIVLIDCHGYYRVSFGHRPNPEGYDGKSFTTGKVEHYTPETYDKGGWNIPDVKYWLDIELPKQ